MLRSCRLVVVLVIVLVAAAACAPPELTGRRCNDDDDCAPRERCVDGACVQWRSPQPGDAGQVRRDDAGAPVDGGTPSDDGGAASDDGGAASGDGGAASGDGGAASGDGGAASDDGGAASDDGGPALLDGGELDGGPALIDGGADAGAVDGGELDAGPDDAGPPPVSVLANVPGLSGYSVVYRMQIPTSGARFNSTGAPYSFDGSAALSAPFSRVGYYLELEEQNDERRFVYVEADALSSDPAQLGVPTSSSGAFFQEELAATRVFSNHPGVTSGEGLALNIELWPSDYDENNDDAGSSPAAADDLLYDFGDGSASTSAGHGSMQIHNTAEGRTVFAFNDWGGSHPGEALELGIGNQPIGHPDWTFSDSAARYLVKTLTVVVDAPLDEPALPATLPEPPSDVAGRVPLEERAGYRVVYELAIPEVAAFNINGVPYAVDESADVPPGSYDRVAYYLELGDGSAGGESWLWVSLPSFSLSSEQLGVPAAGSGAFFQHLAGDGRVWSNVVDEGARPLLGVEFWSTNYGTTNTLPVPGASDSVYDFGDRPAAGNYGSMQIHDVAAGETLFAYNRWGDSTSPSDLGIGNSPTGNPDWTFRSNAAGYASRRLLVLVRQRP